MPFQGGKCFRSLLQLQHIILNRQADVSVGLCEPANGLLLVDLGFQRYQGYRDAATGALNATTLIRFLERLTRQQKKKIFPILDNLRVHHSKIVREWLEANADHIEVFYLPSYSPELNPDELLNADPKQRVTSAAPACNKVALTKTAVGALRSIQKQPQRVESYFRQQDVCYAAA